MSRRRRILLVAGGALAALVLLAPLLARTGVARRFVERRLSKALGRPVEIEGLDAGWTSGVTVRGLVVRNAAAEFQEAPFLEAASVRVENALPGLLLSGADSVTISGLKVRLEEQAGGRTNVDDFVASLAKPRPPRAKREARPFRLRLTGASIHVRTLVRRGQPRPVDPFREDPVILDANEGLLVIGVDDMDLRLDAAPEGTTLELAAALDIAGSVGRADIAVRLGRQGPSGHVRLQGIDLSLLRPFVGALEGRLDLDAEGSPDRVDVKLRATDFRFRDVGEPWADLSLRLRKDGDAVLFDDVALRTASGRFSLDGRGAWPLRDLDLKAQASTEALGLDAKGPLLLHVTGHGPDLAGTLATPDLDARFDVSVRDGSIEIRELDAKSLGSSVSLKGQVADSVRLSGSADLDLASPFLAVFLPEDASLAGRLRVTDFALEDLSLKADAEVSGLLARGFFADDIDIDRGELHVDMALSEDRDVLRVARAQLDGLAAQGTIEGLRHGKRRVEGTVKGTLALNPLHARLLGFREVRGLRGQVTVELTARTDEQGIDASGTAAIDGFHVESDLGSWDLARISADGAYREGNASLDARSDGLVLKGSLAGGKGSVELDVEAIERHPLLVAMLPAALTLRGPLQLRADVEGPPWAVRGTLASQGLTAKVQGRGVDGETLRLSFAAHEEDLGWFCEARSLTLEKLGAKGSVGDGFLGRDGSKHGRVHLEGPLGRFATLAPEASRLAPQGQFVLDATASFDGRWSFLGELGAQNASVLLSGKRAPPRTARLEFEGTLPGDSTLKLGKLRLTTKTTEIDGTAVLGPAITLRMRGRTRLEDLAPYAPMFRGSGEVLLDEVAIDLAGDGAFAASASLHAESIRVAGGKLRKARVRSRAEGRLVHGALEDVKTDLSVKAARAERGNILVEDLVLSEKGTGRSGAYSLGTRVEGGRVRVGATSWEQVTLDVRGRLDRLLAARPPTGLEGGITFTRWNLGPFLWEDGKGEVALEGGTVVVRNLVAGLLGGTARVDGKLTPSGDRLAWEGTAHGEGIVLSEQIGRPLSFIVPFLRVKKEAGKLAGRADFDIGLAAEDTTDEAILRTLAGKGTAHLYDIEAQNSILLPLLSLRLDKAILREPYRFKDLKVAFAVGEGSIRTEPFELEAKPFGIKVKEAEVGLDGSVNALVVPGLLPLRVRGTLDDPDVRPAPLAPFR